MLVAAGIVCMGVTMMYLLYQGAISTQKDVLDNATRIYAQKVNTWLSEQKNVFEPLLRDFRLAGTAQDSISGESRKALYEFRYTQNLKDVYLYDTRNARLMRAPETMALTPQILETFSPENQAEFVAKLVQLNGVVFLITAQRLNYPPSREPVFAIAAQPINAALKNLISAQNAIKQHELGLLYKGSTKRMVPNIHARTPSGIIPPEALFTKSTQTHTAKLTLKNQNILAFTRTIPNFPNWQATISSIAPPTPYGLILLVALLTLVAAIAALNWARILRILLNIRAYFTRRRSPKKMPNYNYASFTAPNAPTTNKYGRKDSISQPTATPPRILASLRPTGHLKTWENVQDSIKEDRTLLLYQPIIDIQTGKPITYETFLRVVGKDGSHMPPGKFLPAMEHYHAAGNLDSHVLDKLINSHFQDGATPDVSFAINLTGQAFDAASFFTILMEKMPEHALPYIGFELRHHEIRKDSAAQSFIAECSDMGLKFSVDYFGGGKAMLGVAQKMGFNWVKVTKEALAEEGLTLAELATAAQELEVKLILEKIETEAEFEEAKALGIPYAQGYFISKPAPWDEVLK